MKSVELKEIVEHIMEKEGLSVTQIAGKTGLNRSHLSTVLNDGSEKEAGGKVLNKLKKWFPDYFPQSNETNNGLSSQNRLVKPGNGDILADLVQSNKSLSESIRIQAEANRSISDAEKINAENNRELISMVKQSTGGSDEETISVVDARLKALQEFLIEQTVMGKKYKSPDQAREALNKLTGDFLKKDVKTGIRVG